MASSQDENDLFNPFRQLNKKQFPDKKKRDSSVGAGNKTPPPSLRSQSPESGEDEALFMEAIGGVRPLGEGQPARPHENDARWAEHVMRFDRALPSRKNADASSKNHAAAISQNTNKTSSSGRKATPQPGQSANTTHTEPEDEYSVFTQAMKDVAPLAGKGRDVPPAPEPPATPPVQPEQNPMQDFMDGKLEFALHHTSEYVEGHVLGLDLMTVGKLQAGHFSPEAYLDLHGLNALQAYQRLIGFMRSAYLRSQRTVLVVTGRGLNSPNGVPVLREKVQTWLTQDPMKRVVLAFCTAQASDGGAGALYVMLRKFRKDHGKVNWERTPVDPDLTI